jgi:WD40 repeat protein/tRNA A-37 threonylcarbamoyl transferase component Bud32
MLLLNQRYYLIQQVGKGGMGIVYKAQDVQLGNRLVAIKEMSQRNLSREQLIYATTAFKREALLLANLSHQNLPRIYDHFEESGKSYLVMDFIEGETLAELLLQIPGQGLQVEEVLLIAEQLCSVLGYLHTRHPPVIFRDLKPANIMITSHGDHLYLIDFGIARFFKPGQLQDTLFIGTTGYAPLEQYNAQTSAYSDIYSLGVTLHQLLTGLDPTKSKTPFSFPPVRAYNPQVPPLLETLIMQMVDVTPAKRPASMFTIKQELQLIRQWSQFSGNVQITGSTPAVTLPPPIPPLPQGRTLCIYRRHSDTIHSLSWSPDGNSIVSGSRDKTAQVWHAHTGDRVFTYKNHSSYVYGVAWSPDGKRIASTSFGNVHVWDATSGDNRLLYREHSLWVYAVAWAPAGLMLASCGADGEVHLWDAQRGESICKYQGYSRAVRAIAWSHDIHSARLLVGCEDAMLYCWEVARSSNPVLYQGHKKEITAVAWSPDGKQIVSGGRDKTVKVWDIATRTMLYTYQHHTKDVHAVAWSPDGRFIASAGEDKTVRIWDATTGNTIYTYSGHTKEVYAVAWSPDGKCIASAGEDKTVHVWQLA